MCGSSISIPAKDTDEKADVDALRMKMVEELDKRGVDVSDIKNKILKRRQRRLQVEQRPSQGHCQAAAAGAAAAAAAAAATAALLPF